MNKINFNRLQNARIYRGFTIAELSKELGISKQAFSKYETSDNVPLEKVFQIAKILNFPTEYFFQSEDKYNLEVKSTYFRSLLTTKKKCRKEQIVKMQYLSIIHYILNEYVEFPSLNIPYDLPFDITPEEAANELRKHWNLGNKPINNIIQIAEENGIIVTKFKTDTDNIDAFSTLINLENKGLYLVALNKNTTSACRIHFDVAHEFGHILLDEWNEDIETLDREEFKNREKIANSFAAAFLLPKDEFIKDISLYPSNLDYYVELKKKWKVSIAAMIYRARELNVISQYQYQYLFKKMNYRDILKKEPLDDILKTSEPSLLNEAIDILLDNKVFTKQELLDEFKCHEFSIGRENIEALLNLPDNKLFPEYEENRKNIVSLKNK